MRQALENAISQVERLYLVNNRDGLCVDWMAFRERNYDGFLHYLKLRQELRRLLNTGEVLA